MHSRPDHVSMQNNHVIPLFPLIIEVSYTLSREARCCTSQLLSISEAYCARLSPKGCTGTLRKWLYSIDCPRALDGKGPKCTVASRAWVAVTPSPGDCRLETISTPAGPSGSATVLLLPGALTLQ